MTDWETIGIIGLILPVDAVLVSFLMALWLKRMLRQIWMTDQQKKKKWKLPWSN